MDTRGGATIDAAAGAPVDADLAVGSDAGREPARRHFAVALLILAVVAALCIPGLLGRYTQGRAAAAPPAPAPDAGQCRAPMDTPTDRDRVIGMPVISCDEPHSGEIVFVGEFDSHAEYPQTLKSPDLDLPRDACEQQVAGFVGISGDGTVSRSSTVPHAVPRYRVEVSVPNPHQWASGQRWYSCQVMPAGRDLPISYPGSVAGAAAGPLPAEFARCAQVIGGDPVPCTEPHLAEKISATVRMDRSAPLDCTTIATRILETDDPTYDLVLSITPWSDRQGRACWATSTNGVGLIGTLVGWGDEPLDIQ